MSGSITIIWILGTLYGASIDGFAQLQTTLLDSDHQEEGNRGWFYRPKDLLGNDSFFTLSARTRLDQNDPYNPAAIGVEGTVVIGDEGTGVLGPNGNQGNDGISGNGGWADEELIFNFDAPILASSIILGLTQIRFDTDGGIGGRDDNDGGSSGRSDMPVVFLSVMGSDSYDITIRTSEIEDAFSPTDRDRGLIDFSAFDMLPPDLMIDSFKIRETNDRILVNSITNQVPEPSFLLLLSAGSLPLILKRRRRAA